MKKYPSDYSSRFQTLWTSSEAEPSAEGGAPAEKKDEAAPAEAEKPAEQ
jgi:hypothetical protein